MSRLWILLVPLLAGCAIATTEPLADPRAAAVDEALLGHWLMDTPDRGQLHLFIGKHDVENNPTSLHEIVMVDWRPAEKFVRGNADKMYVTATRIGKFSYLNFLTQKKAAGQESYDLSRPGSYEAWTKDPNHHCLIFRYECDGGRLRVWTIKDDLRKQLLREKRLEIVGDPDVTVASLLTVLRKDGGDTIFAEKMIDAKRVPFEKK